MKNDKKRLHSQRHILDEKIENALKLKPLKKGWIKSVRMVLGITTRQLADLMNVGKTSVSQIEAGEVKQSTSLKNLFKAAEAMDCEVVYMVVPKSQYKSFDDILEKKAEALAKSIVQGVSYSMNLEQQGVKKTTTDKQIKQLALELKQDLDPRLWIKNK
jgi:predicted DNA-binding mobile mystery protein A